MSAQGGMWNFDGKPIDSDLVVRLNSGLARYGKDGHTIHLDRSVAMLYRPFHTTAESRLERQPYTSPRGFVVTWDGRLDNRDELAVQPRNEIHADRTDFAIASAA